MSGDDGDVIIADAYAFGATGFDTSAALQAMVSGQPQERKASPITSSWDTCPPSPSLSSASSTLEYANDDFAIAQFAEALGNSTDYNTYLQRSGNWMNIFDSTSGYMQPRYVMAAGLGFRTHQ